MNDRLFFDNILFHKTRAIIVCDWNVYFNDDDDIMKCFMLQAPILRGYTNAIPEDKADDLHETLEVLDKYLKNGQWIALDHYTLADFHTLPIVTNVQVSFQFSFDKIIL